MQFHINNFKVVGITLAVSWILPPVVGFFFESGWNYYVIIAIMFVGGVYIHFLAAQKKDAWVYIVRIHDDTK